MQRLNLTVIAFLALASPVLGYVNGGDYYNTLHKYRDGLRKEGWAVCIGEEPYKVIPPQPKDANPTSQMIARAIQDLPKDQREAITLETKHELAMIAVEAFKVGNAKNDQKIVEGRTGNLQYRLGSYVYESYWETNYKGGPEGGRRRHAHRSGLATFVAIQIVAAESKK